MDTQTTLKQEELPSSQADFSGVFTSPNGVGTRLSPGEERLAGETSLFVGPPLASISGEQTAEETAEAEGELIVSAHAANLPVMCRVEPSPAGGQAASYFDRAETLLLRTASDGDGIQRTRSAARVEAAGQIRENLLEPLWRCTFQPSDGFLGEPSPDLLQLREQGAALIGELDDDGPAVAGGAVSGNEPGRLQLLRHERDARRLAAEGRRKLDLRALPVGVQFHQQRLLAGVQPEPGELPVGQGTVFHPYQPDRAVEGVRLLNVHDAPLTV